MLDVFNFPTPQSANYQAFYGGGGSGAITNLSWVKPRGVSMVRFLLIGAGGGGGNGSSTNGGGGGGSGAMTSWVGPAMFVPDQLVIVTGLGGTSGIAGTASYVRYLKNDATGYYLLTANGGTSGNTTVTAGSKGTTMSPNFFTASGIFSAINGQDGAAGNATSDGTPLGAASNTVLSGGAGGSGSLAGTGGAVAINFGYAGVPTTPAGGTVKGGDGYFMTQPFLLGCGGAGGTTSTTVGTGGGRGGIGCGGGGSGEDGNSGGRGGDGAVFVWAW